MVNHEWCLAYMPGTQVINKKPIMIVESLDHMSENINVGGYKNT